MHVCCSHLRRNIFSHNTAEFLENLENTMIINSLLVSLMLTFPDD